MPVKDKTIFMIGHICIYLASDEFLIESSTMFLCHQILEHIKIQ